MTDGIKTEPVDFTGDHDALVNQSEDSLFLNTTHPDVVNSFSIKCEKDEYIIDYNHEYKYSAPTNESDPLAIKEESTDEDKDSPIAGTRAKRKLKHPGYVTVVVNEPPTSEPSTSGFLPFPTDHSLAALLAVKHFPKKLYVGFAPYTCANCCDCFFREYGMFREHVVKAHKYDPIVICDICNIPCGSFQAFKMHKDSSHNDDKELCTICNEWVFCALMFSHLKLVHNLINKQLISKVGHNVKKVTQKPKILKGTEEKKPDVCKCRLTRLRTWKKNKTTTHDEDAIPLEEKCDHCGGKLETILKFSKLSSKSYLLKDLKTGTKYDSKEEKQEKFVCYFVSCNLVFFTQEDLENHKPSHHTGRLKKRYKCDICSATYLKIKHLQSHQTLHGLESRDTTTVNVIPSKHPKKLKSQSVFYKQRERLKEERRMQNWAIRLSKIATMVDGEPPESQTLVAKPTESLNTSQVTLPKSAKPRKTTKPQIPASKVICKSDDKKESTNKCYVCDMEFKTSIGLKCHEKVSGHEIICL